MRRTAGITATSTLVACVALGCSSRSCSKEPAPSDSDTVVVALPEPERPPVPRKRMAWIPPGAFVAGTPPDTLPRIADEEMPGVQIVLHGYYIDQYPFPNEPGAIQATNVTRDEAQTRCEALDKRLCTEIEWERACKGPNSTTYEYGAAYNAAICVMNKAGNMAPSGTSAGCRSGYDVADLHGGAFEWTASPWNRGSASDLVVVRGGSGEPGEVVGRCANARARRPDRRFADVGFRCCAGEPNEAEVSLEVVRPTEPLKALARSPEMTASLEQNLPEELTKNLPEGKGGEFRIERVWKWYPIGNEEIVMASGCAHPTAHAVCGVVIARLKNEKLHPLAFAPSGWWLPNIQLDDDRRILWVYGGDGLGKYRRRVAYLWGRIGVGEPELGGVKVR